MTKYAVYGGGPVAMVFALLLKQQMAACELWRPYLPEGQTRGARVFALNRRALDFLKKLGLNLTKHLHPIRSMRIWDAKTFAQVNLHASDIGVAALAYTLDEHELWELIHAHLLQQGIKIYDLGPDETCIQTPKGWTITNSSADFLGIADGAQSKLRHKLKVPCAMGSYRQQALVASLKLSRPFPHIAFQAFGPQGPLALLPQGDNQYSMVWSLDIAQAQALLALDTKEFAKALGLAMDFHLGEVMAIEGLSSYPLHWLHAKAYYGKNWVLAGDAAHHFHPMAGLGLNSGFGDLASLAEFGFSPTGLGRYQRARKAQITPIMLGMKFLKYCFAKEDSVWVKLRSLGMDVLDHQLLMKKMMTQMAQEL